MSTRSAQIELLASPLIDPTTGSVCAGYTAYFYAAGTSTAKNVWTETAKTNPFTSYALDSAGKVLLYGDGIYKIVIKNADGTTVLSLDNQKIQATTFSVVQKTSTYTATPDDDVIICVSGTWTLSLQTVANFEHPLDILNVGSGTITVDPSSTQEIGGNATVALGPGQRMRIVPDTTSTTWRRVDFSADLSGTELILDVDGDTSITADTDDQIDIKVGGTDRLTISSTAIVSTIPIDLNGNAAGLILDTDGDTKISSDSDDYIVVATGGAARAVISDLGLAVADTGAFFVNAIAENASNVGVTVDGCLIKDGAAAQATLHGVLNVKVINIGDWDMDSTNAVSIAHGLTLSKIRPPISALIIGDGGATYYAVGRYSNAAGYEINISVNATNVVMLREASGTFDSTNFDETSFNRGYITIYYVD